MHRVHRLTKVTDVSDRRTHIYVVEQSKESTKWLALKMYKRYVKGERDSRIVFHETYADTFEAGAVLEPESESHPVSNSTSRLHLATAGSSIARSLPIP